MSKQAESAARWREWMERQVQSGLSVAAFCRRHDLAPATFYAWRRKLDAEMTFAEVNVTPLTEPATESPTGIAGERVTEPLEVILPHGRRIAVRPGFDRPTLQALLDALEHHGADPDAVS